MAALATLPGCGRIGSRLARLVEGTPTAGRLPKGEAAAAAFRLLSRAAYGPRPGDVERVVSMGRDAWIDEQLAPERIDDSACELRLSDCELIADAPQDLMSVQEHFIDRQLTRAALIRAVHSKRRLLEVMTGFWSDHFSVDTGKKGCVQTKPIADKSDIRRLALGRFRDLLGAVALSPVMLFYLDGAANKRAAGGERANENYARELMELHTLGVRGGYTQRDIEEAARCLTGWTVENRGGWHIFHGGETVFREDWHDDGEKTVLGVTVPAGGGRADAERLLDIVASHPSTLRRIAWKLCRRLVADPPPETVVALAEKEFATTRGDLAAVVRQILVAADTIDAPGKVRRPFEFMVSALRATGAECRATDREVEFLSRMGHVPFHYPTPDGYPEEPEPWMATLLWRWNFALALTTNRLGDTHCDLEALARRAGLDPKSASPADLAPLFLGREASAEERATIDGYAARSSGDRAARRREAVALLLASPAFQVA